MSRVTILPNLFIRAWAGEPLSGRSATHLFSDTRAVPLLAVEPLRHALNAHRAPALMVAYAPPAPRASMPRLAKAAVAHYLSEPEATRPQLTSLIVDIDHDNHTPPPDDWAHFLLSGLKPPFDQPMWYRTPNGLRLVYELATPVDITLAQSFLTQALAELRTMGIPTDEGTEDWTRLFKLPTPGLPHDFTARPPLQWTPPRPLEVESVTALGAVAPTPRPSTPRTKLTRRDLKQLEAVDPRLADALYHSRLRANVGDRHRVLLGAAIKIARAYDTNDPALIYDYLAAAAEAMGKTSDELWSIATWAAAARSGHRQLVHSEREAAVLRASAAMGCRPDEVPQRLIVDTGAEQFVWDEESGSYSSGYTKQHQLLPALDRHCPGLLPDYYDTFADPIRHHSSHARKLVYSYDPSFSGYDAHTSTMYVTVCQPDPSIEAVYSEEVDEWLQGTFGLSPYYDNFLDWIAKSYDLRAPVCALYIEGGQGVGKNLFAKGWARNYSPESPTVSYDKLLADFNQPLLDSPLIVADEKVPTDRRGSNESAVFRRAVGNDGFRINAKFRTEATLLGYPRMLILANNTEALRINEDLTEDDIDAIRIRMGYIRIPDEADGFLSDMAARRGYPTVRAMVDPWVKQGTIAGHFKWLAESRAVTEGDRFLVEGWDSELTETLPSTVGSAGIVVDAIVNAVASGHFYASVRWFDGNVYVSNPLLPRDWEELMRGERLPSNAGRLKALKSLSSGNTRTLDLPATIGKRQQKQYWQLPGKLIAQIAEDRGVAPAQSILDAVARGDEGLRPTLEETTEDAEKVLAYAK